jgi:Glucodextranase, domain B
MRLSLSVSIAALAFTACGGWKRTGSSSKAEIGGENIATVELTLANVTREQAQAFSRQLDDYGDVKKVELKSYTEGVAIYDVDVQGCECEVPAMVARIPSPGFKYQGRQAKFRYAAFDNIPPKLVFVKPAPGAVFKERQVEVQVDVPDADVAEVSVNGQQMQRSGSRFTTLVALKEGANDLTAVAKDASGNEGRGQLRIGLDTTPPDITTAVTVIIDGKVEPGTRVYVNGDEVKVDSAGRYEAKVKVKRGQREVEVVAVDQYGNRNQTMRPIGD